MYLLIFLNIALLVIGQTLWKIGLSDMSSNANLNFNVRGIIRIFLNPCIFGGLIIYALATVIWLYILSKEQLSVVYPLQSLCYVAAAIIALLVFKESIPITRWIGIGLIVVGAYFVALK